MNFQKLCLFVFICLLHCAFFFAFPDEAGAGGYFLVDGVGLEGQLEVGGPVPKSAPGGAPDGQWHPFPHARSPLKFKAADGIVVMIMCDSNCLTNRNISIGSQLKQVYWRYGKPLEKKALKDKPFLVYNGVGFLMDSKGERVEAIYIFPHFKK